MKNYLKNPNKQNELDCKSYKHIFESVKKRSKKLHSSKVVLTNKNNIRKTLKIIKDHIGQKKFNHNFFPKKVLKSKKHVTNVDLLAENFNKDYSEIVPKLAANIEESLIDFKSYIQKYESVQSERDLTVNRIKEAIFLLKPDMSSGYDGTNFNVIKTCSAPLIKPLMHIFNSSLVTGIFPNDSKIARVTAVFKTGDYKELGNYGPISVLPCLSETLERFLLNRLFSYLTTNEILYQKQFGHSTGQIRLIID